MSNTLFFTVYLALKKVSFIPYETYISDLMNAPAQNVSYMKEIYYLMKNTLIVKKK